MTDANDPWSVLPPPDHKTNVSSRRVDASLPWDIFWAVDVNRHCLLILQHNLSNKPKNRLPQLRGLTVEIHALNGSSPGLLIIRLMDHEQREIFHRLCLDIIETTRQAKSEQEAIERFIARTWRWHWLLRGGRDGRLSDEEQKGLLGELSVLRDILFAAIGVEEAIKSWTGRLVLQKILRLGEFASRPRLDAAVPHLISPSRQNTSLILKALMRCFCIFRKSQLPQEKTRMP